MKRLVAAVVAPLAAAGGLWLLRAGAREAPAEPPPALPHLDTRCTAAPTAREQRGRDAAGAAAAAIERYPFDPGAGLAALQLLLEAERCFALASRHPAAAETAGRARAFRARMQGDCRDHFLRFRMAQASERLEHALGDVEFLLALCAPEHGPLAKRLQRARIEITERTHEETP